MRLKNAPRVKGLAITPQAGAGHAMAKAKSWSVNPPAYALTATGTGKLQVKIEECTSLVSVLCVGGRGGRLP